MTQSEAAWAAGLFEGEGCIRYHRDQISLKLGMTDLDVVERFRDVVGCGVIREQKKAEDHHKPFFEWRVIRKEDVHRTMSDLLPFLGKRRTARWSEVLELRSQAFSLRVCPQCEKEFAPKRKAQVCCGRDCSWRYSARVGKYTDRAGHQRSADGYANEANRLRSLGRHPETETV